MSVPRSGNGLEQVARMFGWPPDGYERKVIRIQATDSPNVRYALAEIEAGLEPSGRIIVPGVKSWEEYQSNLRLWDEHQKAVSLRAEFYEGADVKLYPKEWIDRAEQVALRMRVERRQAKAVGIDPAEGGDKTAMVAVDEWGVLELVSKKTPDTAAISTEAVEFIRRHGVPPDRVCFDRGGGGKIHADIIRRDHGLRVRTVAFGESLVPDPKRGITLVETKKEQREEHYAYRMRRDQMYGALRVLLDPSLTPEGFGVPGWMPAFREQMEPIPLIFDQEGRLKLPAKNRRSPDSDEVTLVELIGHSPDELDALALAVYAMQHKGQVNRAGGG